MAENASSNPYTQVIDLTTAAQREKRQQRHADQYEEPEDALPETSLEALPDLVQQAARAAGWEDLMEVQRKAVPYILEGRDLIVQSRTGSGKTGAFLLPLFEVLEPARREVQALILTPTRELARQINEEFERMKVATTETNDLESVLIYGGVGYGPQIQALQRGVQVVIGTPGRILDHLQKKNLQLDGLSYFVFDEADEMLSMGFYPAMQQLKRYLPRKPRNSHMFSATIPPKVQSLGREFLHEPTFLGLSTGQVSVAAIDHRYYLVPQMEKDRALIRLIEMENPESAIIFSNTKRDVGYLTKFLSNFGHDADEISGDLSQQARERAMDRIRDGKLRFLVATDVAARGIDISDLSHVICYDVPEDPELYVHRTGRTARAGKSGVALMLATHDDKFKVDRIAAQYGVEIERRELPTEEEVSQRVAERMIVVLEEQMRKKSNLERERMQRFVPVTRELAREEPELLALLIDRLYHEQLHARPDVPAEKTPTPEGDGTEAEARQPRGEDEEPRREKKKSKGRGRGRGGRRRGGRNRKRDS